MTLKIPPGKLLQLINIVSIVTVHKTTSQKSVVFLYTTDQWFEKEIMETVSFTKASNNISWENSKQVKDFYGKKIFKTLKKDIEKDIRECFVKV